MNRIHWLVYIFLGVGVVMLIGALASWNSTRGFVARAHQAEGEIIELREVVDRDDDGSSTWKPVVRFTADDGRSVTFAASFSSNPAPYGVGETVTVLYRPGKPEEARIQGFGSLWMGAIIAGGLGLVFTLIGSGMWVGIRKGNG